MATLPPDRVTPHLDAFNTAVTSGEWASFSERFAEDASMAFHGAPVGPFSGREAIRAAYVSSPPDDTMTAIGVESEGDADAVAFRWDRGGTGTMRFEWRDGLVSALEVAFDS